MVKYVKDKRKRVMRPKIDIYLFELAFRYATNAVGSEVRVAHLDAAQAAQVFIALLLPFGDQILVGNVLFDAVVVQL